MTELNQIYKCSVCGNIVEVAHASAGTLVCCNKPMELLIEKTEDQGYEKHVPVIEKTRGGVKVKIGSIPHPMIPEHYIEFIEILTQDRIYRKYLKPGDAPEAEFKISLGKNDKIAAREYCNIHGLWIKK
ncbi:MAG: desulfoferrodoxin [Candidatus Micrarchaeota archaeon]|nr:desulfoferrodoxin [Candidatus Micrarchaeota archaeon]